MAYPIDPSSRGGKGYHRYIRIKKVNKQFVRAGCGTRPSREGRAAGGVRSGPLLIGAKRSGRLLTRARKRLWLSGLGGTAAEPSSPRVSVTRWEKESSPVIHSRTALQLLPSIRRRNWAAGLTACPRLLWGSNAVIQQSKPEKSIMPATC